MEIRLCKDQEEAVQCAILMQSSDPWQTLGFNLERCASSLQGDYRELYIAYDGEAFAGFVVLQFYGLLRGYIQTICIEAAFRGQGIGTALLKFSETRIRQISPNVFICVSSFNTAAQRLYQRLGYEQVGVLKDHLVRGHDEYLLRKSAGPFNEFSPATDTSATYPKIIRTNTLTEDETAQIDRLWNEEYPTNLSGRFGILLDGVSNYHHYLLKDSAGRVIAWAVDFEKEGEIRFSIIVSGAQQGMGWGKLLLDNLKLHIPEFYGWVIDHDRDLKANKEHYQTPMPFYLKAGFEVLSDQRIEADIISAVKIRWRRTS